MKEKNYSNYVERPNERKQIAQSCLCHLLQSQCCCRRFNARYLGSLAYPLANNVHLVQQFMWYCSKMDLVLVFTCNLISLLRYFLFWVFRENHCVLCQAKFRYTCMTPRLRLLRRPVQHNHSALWSNWLGSIRKGMGSNSASCCTSLCMCLLLDLDFVDLIQCHLTFTFSPVIITATTGEINCKCGFAGTDQALGSDGYSALWGCPMTGDAWLNQSAQYQDPLKLLQQRR